MNRRVLAVVGIAFAAMLATPALGARIRRRRRQADDGAQLAQYSVGQRNDTDPEVP